MSSTTNVLCGWLALSLALASTAKSQARSAAQRRPTVGPSAGWLLLEGGGRLSGTEVATRFVSLAGGPQRHYAVVVTATSDSALTPAQLDHVRQRTAEVFGAREVAVLDAASRREASSDAFVSAIEHADAVWILGGDEGRLVDCFVGTRAEHALRALLDRGGVVGGTSAGAMILGAFVPSRASAVPSGFGFLESTTIAPHFAQRHYAPALERIVAAHPSLRGIGIDESTAIVAHGDEIEVIGDGTVTVYDRTRAVLSRGQHFDLRGDTTVARHR